MIKITNRIVLKIVKGGPFGVIKKISLKNQITSYRKIFETSILLQIIKKFKGKPFGDVEKFLKSHKAEKEGKPHSVKKSFKNGRGTLCTEFALAGLGALGGFRIVS